MNLLKIGINLSLILKENKICPNSLLTRVKEKVLYAKEKKKMRTHTPPMSTHEIGF